MSNRLWLRLPTGVQLTVGIAYNAGSILSGNGCGEYYESQSRLLFAADPRRDRQPVYISSLYYMVTARQRTDAGDLRHGQNGGAKSLAQSARVHITDVWRCRRMARRDSRSATLSPQNTQTAIQNLLYHQRIIEHLRDGSGVSALSFFAFLNIGYARTIQLYNICLIKSWRSSLAN